MLGHSFGGTFATYALLEKPELFDAFITVNPYVMYDNNYMVNIFGLANIADKMEKISK